MGAGFWIRSLVDNNRAVVVGHDENNKCTKNSDPFEEQGHAIIRRVKLPERAICRRRSLDTKEETKYHNETEHTDPGESALVLQLHEGIDHENKKS